MDFNAAMETFAEAWVAANTQTAVNSGEPQNVRQGSGAVDLPTPPSKEQLVAGGGRMPTGTTASSVPKAGARSVTPKQAMSQHMAMAQTAAQNASASSTGKSIPIHCIVEQTCRKNSNASSSTTALPGAAAPPQSHNLEPVVELDTYAILPSTTLFNEIVRTALVKIGYTASEAMGAKGAIQIKNWKPLTFDTVTENPNATVETILGDLTSVATVRIRLCSQSKLVAMEDVKEKLLNFLLQHSQSVLTSSGCPIGKTVLKQITLGGLSPSLPEETRDAFNKWYKEQIKGQVVPTTTTSPPAGTDARRLEAAATVNAAVAAANMLRSENPMALPTYSLNRTRMRTSFDPENEIPRLQKWFQENEHPSREQMLVFLHELNNLDSRRGRKPLDLTNIVYWFKNARAAQRRANKSLDTSNDESRSEDHGMEVDENENETLNEHLSPPTSPEAPDNPNEPVPVLPNRHAVYVVKPLEIKVTDEEVIRIQPEDMDEPEKASTPVPQDLSHGLNPLKPEGGHSRTSSPAPSNPEYPQSHKDENELQEEATDLSMRSRRDSSDSCTTTSSLHLSHSGSSFKMNSSNPLKREREDDELSSTNTGTPSPPRIPTQMQQLQAQQHALQMAAMSHALNMQYMHPSVYNAPIVTAPYPSKEMKYPPQNHTPPSSDLMDKKKRSRVFIDPLSEIPKMEKWFIEDTHPSSYMIEKYTDELNRSTYRQRFPRLEPKNVQLWFKNHRAKVKRARLEMANNNSEGGQMMHSPSAQMMHSPISDGFNSQPAMQNV